MFVAAIGLLLRCAHEIAANRRAVLVGNLHRLAFGRQVGNKFFRAGFHFLEGRQAARIFGREVELGLAIVIGGAQKAVHGAANVSEFLLGKAAVPVVVGDDHPFLVPGLLVAGDHATRGEETFAHRAAAFLRLAQCAAELVGQPGVFGPVVPAIGLVVGLPVGGDFFNQIVFGGVGVHDFIRFLSLFLVLVACRSAAGQCCGFIFKSLEWRTL